MATYGGRNVENTFTIPQLQGDNSEFYTVTDAATGKTELYRKQIGGGLFGDAEVGSYEPGGDFTPGKDFEDVFQSKDAQKKFLSDESQKVVKDQTSETVVRAQKEAGVEEVVARTRADQLLQTGKQTTPTDADPDTLVNDRLNSLSDLKIENKQGTKSGSGSFGEYRYPVTMSNDQDFIQFTLLEYKAKKVGDSSSFGFGNRTRVGPDGQAEGRTRLGSVSLPIPGGIKDENGAVWGGDKMNELQIQGSDLARSLTGASGQDPGRVAKAIADRIGGNSADAKTAIQESFAGNAVGAQNLLSRTRGAVLNPNLELLFQEPSLRPFSFSFDLSARSKDEADAIVNIIKFFKQGMAPIRSESNLFLLAPHTFQVHYIYNGDTANEHPYIGKMKECAMTNFSVDYTPQQNYSTLKDGYMTTYRITMQLKELEPIFNDDYGTTSKVEIGF